ncbi:hypothetical protein ACFOLJ_05825 [Rugamonas sp. CCM 8940]
MREQKETLIINIFCINGKVYFAFPMKTFQLSAVSSTAKFNVVLRIYKILNGGLCVARHKGPRRAARGPSIVLSGRADRHARRRPDQSALRAASARRVSLVVRWLAGSRRSAFLFPSPD